MPRPRATPRPPRVSFASYDVQVCSFACLELCRFAGFAEIRRPGGERVNGRLVRFYSFNHYSARVRELYTSDAIQSGDLCHYAVGTAGTAGTASSAAPSSIADASSFGERAASTCWEGAGRTYKLTHSTQQHPFPTLLCFALYLIVCVLPPLSLRICSAPGTCWGICL
jgi:hypothetical protein